MLSALPAASIIILSVGLGCRACPAPTEVAATTGRCAWAAVAFFAVLGPAVALVRSPFSGLDALPLLLQSVPLSMAVVEGVHPGVIVPTLARRRTGGPIRRRRR